MLVCPCAAVNDRTIRGLILEGACDARRVAERCGAGAECGACRPLIEELLAESAFVGLASR